MNVSFAAERAVLRLRLQANREKLARRFGEKTTRAAASTSVFAHSDTFPRSIAMRLLTNRQNFMLLAAAELFPLLVRHLLKSTEQDQRRNDDEE